MQSGKKFFHDLCLSGLDADAKLVNNKGDRYCLRRCMTHLIRLADIGGQRTRLPDGHLFFTRAELMMLMGWYSTAVSRGEWRDYALDHLSDAAMFSVFRHAHEQPLFSIVKTMTQGRKSPVFSLWRGPRRLGHAATLSELMRRMRDRPCLVDT